MTPKKQVGETKKVQPSIYEASKSTANIPPLLFHPHLRDKNSLDESLSSEKTLTLRIAWTHKDAKYIQQWLETKNFDRVADLLRLRPHNMANPLVFNQILHLRKLLDWGAWDEEGRIYTPLVLGQEEPLEYDAKLAIKKTLHALLSAWVSIMLPGYAIVPNIIPPKKGRQNLLDWYHWQELLMEFNELMTRLEAEEETLTQKRGERSSAFCKRIAQLLQKMHDTSSYAKQMYNEENKASSKNDRSLFTTVVKFRKVKFESSRALSIARQSIGKKGKVRLRKLSYALLSMYHRHLGGPEKIRGYIERGEATFKHLHKYKVAKGNRS